MGSRRSPEGRVGIVSGQLVSSPPSTSVHVDRLLSNGAVDSTFPRVSTPMGGDLIASDIAGAADGGVLVDDPDRDDRRAAPLQGRVGIGAGAVDAGAVDGFS